MKRAALFGALAVLLLLVAGAFLIAIFGGDLRQKALRQLEQVLGADIELASLEVGMLPPRVILGALSVGTPPFLVLEHAVAQVRLGDSLRAGRLQVEVALQGLRVDSSATAEAGEAEIQDALGTVWLPAIDLVLRIDGADMRLDEEHSVSFESLAATVAVDSADAARLQLDSVGLTLAQGDRRSVLGYLTARLEWLAPTLSIEGVELSGGDLQLEMRPASERQPGQRYSGLAPIAVRLGGEIGPVVDFLSGEPVGVSGDATIMVTIAGDLSDPAIEGTVRLDETDFVGVRFSRLDLDLQRADGRWLGRDIEANWPGGLLVGELDLDESDWRLTGDIGWRDVETAALIGLSQEWRSQTSGDVAVTADLDEFELSLKGKGRLAAQGTEELPFDVALVTDGETFSAVADFAIDAENGLRVEIGRFDEGGASGEVTAAIASLERVASALGYEGRLALRGGLAVQATLSGTSTQPIAEMEIVTSNARLADGSAVEFTAGVRLSSSEGVIDNLALVVGSGRVVASGTIALADDAANDWSLRADDLALEPIIDALRETVAPDLPRLGGTLDGSLEAGGAWSVLQAKGSLQIDRAVVEEVVVGSIAVDGEVVSGHWQANVAIDGAGGEGKLALAVRGDAGGVMGVEGALRKWPLAALSTREDLLIAGTVTVEADVDANQRGASGAIDVWIEGLMVGDQMVGDTTLRAAGKGGPWTIEGTLLGQTLLVDGRIDNDAGGPFSIRVHWQDSDVPAAVMGSDEVRVTSSGELIATGRLTDLAASEAKLGIETLQVARGRQQLDNREPIRVELSAGSLRLESFTLAGGATNLSATGNATAAGHSRARLEGTLALGWLEFFVPSIDASGGELELAIDVVAAPNTAAQLAGTIALRDGELEVEGAPPIRGMRGDLALESSRISTRTLSGEIGGGRFTISGVVDLAEGPGLEWSIRNVSLEPADRLELVLSGRGSLSGPWDDAVLAGDLTIGDLLYDRNVEFQDLIPSFDRAVRPPPGRRADRPPLRLNLRVAARDGMYVENNIANLEARTDLRITGNVRNPRMRGAIEIIDGSIMLRGRDFEVVTGSLSFRPDLPGQAYIDFMAESVIESGDVPYGVQVRVSGTTRNYRVILDSEDGLSQTDIASLIAFGRTASEMQAGGAAGGGLSMEALAGLAGGQVGKMLAGEVGDVLPFDEVELRPGFSPSTGEFEPQIRVGKFITEDLSAWIAQTFGVRSQTAVEVTYALTRQMATSLRWESQTASQEGAFGGELARRVQFWGRPSWLRWGSSPANGDSD